MGKNEMILTRKIQLYPVGDKNEVNRVYKYLRDGMKAQNAAMNQYMSALYTAMLMDITAEDRKELNKLFSRISTSKKGSAYDESIEFAKGLPSASSVAQKVKQDFDTAMKKGLRYGLVSLPTYHNDNPLLIHVDWCRLRSANPHNDFGLYHEYTTEENFIDDLYKSRDVKIYLKFANNIVFSVVLGNPHKSMELRSVIEKIFNETYTVGGSSIEIDKNKIILNLSIKIPIEHRELNEDIVIGVDLGQHIPAVCAVNNNEYIREYIGNGNDFLQKRKQIQAENNRLKKQLAYTSGSHGRKKKLKPLDRFNDYEANYARTYNHMVSKRIVDFALKQKAKYINIECLKGINTNRMILRNWSFYQLQQDIIYKAERYGIEVRKVNPCYTSQVCSVCGHWEKGQRESQEVFRCKNPNCINYNKEVNADFNAARNISKSELWQDDEITKESIAQAKSYYGIT